MDCSPPGSSIHGIFQARILEWVSVAFSRDLPNPGMKPRSPALQVDALQSEPPGKLEDQLQPKKPLNKLIRQSNATEKDEHGGGCCRLARLPGTDRLNR